MKPNESLKNFFNQETIVDLLSRYELYYQISLGYFAYETIQDIDETDKKLQELNLRPQPNDYLSNIFEIVLHYSFEENFYQILDYLIRSRASLHALKDFVNNDTELLNINDYIEAQTVKIKNDSIFTDTMKIEFESEYPMVYDYYDTLVTEDIVEKFQENLQN